MGGQRSGKGMVRRLAVVLGSAALLLPLAEPVGQRTGTVARYLLAMAATAMATPVQAQTPLTLASIERQDPTTSPTNADSLTWHVTFSRTVSSSSLAGLEPREFTVSGTTATVSVQPVALNSPSWAVTVSGGNLANLNGTVMLSLATSNTIEANNDGGTLSSLTPTGTNDNFYVVDNTAPSVDYTAPTSLMVGTAIMLTPSTTDSDASGHGYSATGLPAGLMMDASTGVISGSPTTASTATSDVMVTVTDSAGNSVTITRTFPAVDGDTTAPTVTSITRHSPTTSPTNADSLRWRVTFSEAVENVDETDFMLSGSTALLSILTGSSTPSSYIVLAIGGDLVDFPPQNPSDPDFDPGRNLDGTVMLSFASDQDITDEAGNALTDIEPTGTNNNFYVVDNTAPTVISITRQSPTTSPTSSVNNEGVLRWRVTFSETVKNVDAADFELSSTDATLSVAEVEVTDETSAWDVTASGGFGLTANFNGTVTLSFTSDQDITDEADNALTDIAPTGTNDNNYVVDNIAPSVVISGVPTTSLEPFTATFSFSEAVYGFVVEDLDVSNGTASSFTGSDGDTVYTALITPTNADDLNVQVNSRAAEDNAGNVTGIALMFSTYSPASSDMLISNIGQTDDDRLDLGTDNFAQAFTTGTHATGYRLTSVEVQFADVTQVVSYSVGIWSSDEVVNPSHDGDNVHEPLANLGTLTCPTLVIFAYPVYKCTTPGIDLAAETTYLFQIGGTSGAANGLQATNSDGEDSGGASGWSIANNSISRNNGSDGSWTSSSSEQLKIRINGAEKSTNRPATGAPEITGTPQVGQTLSASIGDIADSDGLPATFPEDYTLQWVREDGDGTNPEDISNETSHTYTLTGDDVGKKVRVRVSFTDQLSGMETVTSAAFPASGTVIPIPPRVTISGPSPAVEEGNDLTFTLTLDGAAPIGLTVDVTVAETGDVVAGTDEGSRTVTVTEGQTQATFTVATQNDDAVEADSVVTVEVDADSDDPATYQVGSPSEATATVTDNDTRGVTVSGSPLTVNEGGTGAYGVVLTSRPTGEVTITPSSDNSDVTFMPATLTFTANDWSTEQTVMVSAAADTDNVNDNATISHVVAGADYGDNSVTAASVAVTVSEVVLPVVSIAAGTSPVSEGTPVAFRLTRTGSATDGLTVNVTVTESGEVISGPAPTSVTFGAGSDTATLSVSTDDDDVDEDAGMVTAEVAADSADPVTYVLGTPAPASVTVNDNDARPVVRLQILPGTVTEAAGVSEVRARLSNPSAVETQVTLSIPDTVTGAVQLGAGPVLVILPGTTESSNAVTLTAVDNSADGPDLSVTVSGVAENTLGVTGPDPVTLTITDDDETTPMDTTAPRVTIMNVPATSTAPFTATIAFDEVVSGFMVEDITAVNATLSGFTVTTPGTVWRVLVTPTADGEVTLNIAAGVAQDAANNGNTAAPQATSTYAAAAVKDEPSSTVPDTDTDTTAPTVTITNVPATSSAPFTATITFNEVVSGFMVEDITAVNATLSDFTVTTPGTVWTVLVTPTADEVVTLDIAMNVAEDAAGNGNTAAPPARSTYTGAAVDTDTTAPRVTSIMGHEPTTSPTNADSLTWRVTFSEAVTNVDTADFTVSGSTATVSNVQAVDGETLVHDVTASGGDLAGYNGMVRLGFASGQDITDEAGNPLATTTPTGTNNNSYMVDNAAPRLTYTAPTSLMVGTAITPILPSSTDRDIASYGTSATGLPAGLTINATTGVISGTPTTVNTAPSQVVVTVTDTSGNSATVTLTFPMVEQEAAQQAAREAEAVLEEVVLPNLVQQLTAETTEVITSRLNSIASGSPSAPPSLSLDEVVADTVAFFHGEREHLKNGSLEWQQAFSGRDFVWPLSGLNVAQGDGDSTQDHPFSTLALWGGGNYSSYRNIIERTDVDGNSFSGVIGMDLQPMPRLTSGLALTTSRWGLDYATTTNGARAEGTYEIGVTMLHPYVNWWATEQLSAWATFGYGRGEVEQDPEDGNATTRTDGLTSWAGGVRFEVVPGMDPLTGEGSPFGLAFKADGATSSFLDTQVQLARLAAEVSHAFAIEGGLLSAALELGWRLRSVSGKDDLDALQKRFADKNHSGGAELAGSLNWLNADGSLSATVDTRVVLGGNHHREWGMGGHLRFTPSRQAGEGLSLTLQPSFGVTGTRLDELWSLSGDGDLVISNDPPGGRLDAELAYGFPLGDALLTPYTEVAWEGAASIYGAGLRYGLALSSLELDLKGVRRSNADGNTEHRFSLDVRSDL